MICKKTEICFFQLLKSTSDVKCKNKNHCVAFCDKRSDAACKEKGKSYHLRNTENNSYQILSIHIDGGVITEQNTSFNISKCDYLYLASADENQKPIAILIELKGTHLKKAIEQIEQTLALFDAAFQHCGKVYGRIVFAGGTPKLQNTPAFMTLQRLLKKRGGNLMAAENITDHIQNLI